MPSQQLAVMQEGFALGFDELLINNIINSFREVSSPVLPMKSEQFKVHITEVAAASVCIK